MTDMFILLTGGHTGLGLGVTKKLLQPGNKIGLIIRSEKRKDQTISEFADFPKDIVDDIDFFYADLSDQAQVKAVAAEIRDNWPRIDRLFNNAAVVGGPDKGRNTSKQGNEWHYEINTLAPYILTTELKPLLEKSEDAKVITTVTDGMQNRQLDTDLMLNSDSSRTMMLYMHSKQAVMFLMNDLANQWNGVEFLAVNPGPNKTKMTQGGNTPWIIRKVLSLFFNDPSVGSQLIYNAGFDSQFAKSNKVYLTKNKIVPVSTSMSADEKAKLLAGIKV